MTSKMVATLEDFSLEKSSLSVNVEDLTIINIVAQTADMQALMTDIESVTLGRRARHIISQEVTAPDGTPVSASEAQREMKWLVRYTDTVTAKSYRTELPCADITDATLLVAGSDLADLTDLKWISFVGSFETVVTSEVGNPVSIVSVTLVGRRS